MDRALGGRATRVGVPLLSLRIGSESVGRPSGLRSRHEEADVSLRRLCDLRGFGEP